jgi:hypothetical protein
MYYNHIKSPKLQVTYYNTKTRNYHLWKYTIKPYIEGFALFALATVCYILACCL